MDVPWAELEAEQQALVLEGEGRFMGVRGFFAHLERKKYKLHVRVFLSRYRGYSTCSECGGARLRAGGAAGEDQRQEHLRSLQHDGGRGGQTSSPKCS